VGDYTSAVAHALCNRGAPVNVWCPGYSGNGRRGGGYGRRDGGVAVHRVLGRLRPSDLAGMGRELDAFPGPRRLLVQWVPHGYGFRSMNLPFCLWLWRRARRGDRVELMVHEPYLAFGEGSWRQNAAAVVHRVMTAVLLRAADRVWSAIPAWKDAWIAYALGRPVTFSWLPVPSTIPRVHDEEAVRRLRESLVRGGRRLVGHFGGHTPAIADRLVPILSELLARRPDVVVLLLGSDGDAFRQALDRAGVNHRARVIVTGTLPAEDIARHLQACDLIVQPYPDGVSTRRTSVMAALVNGVPVATSRGRLTEPCWEEHRAVRWLDDDAPAAAEALGRLLEDEQALTDLGSAGRDLYDARFDVRHTIEALTAN
jgi:glycosyltransferase involved in cell wall biosynthesis